MANIPIDLDKCFSYSRWMVLLSAFVINFLILFDDFEEECDECYGDGEYGIFKREIFEKLIF